jgi:hypothetical protein
MLLLCLCLEDGSAMSLEFSLRGLELFLKGLGYFKDKFSTATSRHRPS